MLDVVDGEVVVSDSGLSVDPEDVGSLFSLFFTRKARGGRGVGLYLSRANLTTGGHRIRYALLKGKPPGGANFAIAFRGARPMQAEANNAFIDGAFLRPIGSVLIVDDDYPMFDELVTTEIRRKKGWYADPGCVKRVIDDFRATQRPLLVDIHDGSNAS